MSDIELSLTHHQPRPAAKRATPLPNPQSCRPVSRFASAEQLASYAGTVPAVKSSGGKTRYGHTPKESNHYLKWAFVEAANGPAQYRQKPHWQHRHVTRLYERVSLRKGHSVAVGAVARHLAEATFWILTKKEHYREPTRQKVLPRQA